MCIVRAPITSFDIVHGCSSLLSNLSTVVCCMRSVIKYTQRCLNWWTQSWKSIKYWNKSDENETIIPKSLFHSLSSFSSPENAFALFVHSLLSVCIDFHRNALFVHFTWKSKFSVRLDLWWFNDEFDFVVNVISHTHSLSLSLYVLCAYVRMHSCLCSCVCVCVSTVCFLANYSNCLFNDWASIQSAHSIQRNCKQ